jgi:hypothetical protein
VNLREVLDAASSGLGDVEVVAQQGGDVAWARGHQVFAILMSGGMAAEFALDPAVAAAAARTPDVVPSSRGRGWVRFAPASLDQHAQDRAAAWFGSASRRRGSS